MRMMAILVMVALPGCSLYIGDDDAAPEVDVPDGELEPRGECRPLDPQVARPEYAACEYVYAGPFAGGGAKPLFCEPGGDPGHAFKTWTKVNPYGETWPVICRCPDDGSGCPDERLGNR